MARTIAKDHDAKREGILKTAAEMFATEGFDSASMAMLAKACGISKANIYHYYDSKDALLFDILDSHLKELRDRVCTLDLEGLTPEAQLRRTVREILLAYQGADFKHRVQTSVVARLPDDQQSTLKGYQRELVAFLRDILARLAPEAFDGDPDKLRATTMSVFAMLNWFYMWNGKAGKKAREDYARLVCDLTIGGVRGN